MIADTIAATASLITTFFLLLLMKGFAPYAFVWGERPIQYLGAGVFWTAIAGLGASLNAWWLRDHVTAFGADTMPTALNILRCYAAWHCLRGLYLAIPEGDRHDYTTITAAFYPRRVLSLWRKKEGEE